MGKYTLFTANNLRDSSTRLYIFSKLIGKTGVVNYLFRLVETLRRASNHMFQNFLVPTSLGEHYK